MNILNLTQHSSTPDQGCIEPSSEIKKTIQKLLTVNYGDDVKTKAYKLAMIADGLGVVDSAMIGGAPFLMKHLERFLINAGITPVYAFSVRKSVEVKMEDGTIQKVSKFKHQGFINADGEWQ